MARQYCTLGLRVSVFLRTERNTGFMDISREESKCCEQIGVLFALAGCVLLLQYQAMYISRSSGKASWFSPILLLAERSLRIQSKLSSHLFACLWSYHYYQFQASFGYVGNLVRRG